jgi:hypothetical protein
LFRDFYIYLLDGDFLCLSTTAKEKIFLVALNEDLFLGLLFQFGAEHEPDEETERPVQKKNHEQDNPARLPSFLSVCVNPDQTPDQKAQDNEYEGDDDKKPKKNFHFLPPL